MRYLLLLLCLTGCAETWAEAPKALDPVAHNVFPVTGKTLQALSASFYSLCPADKPRPPACLTARDALNTAIDAYNAANDLFLENPE